MKKFLLGAAALMATAAPGVAAAQSGHAGLSYTTSDDTDVDSIALSGSALLGANFQLDGGYASLDGGGSSNADFWNVGGHFFARSDSWLWGGYVGYDNIEAGGTSLDEWIIAGETQFYADRTTFSGTLAYAQADYFVDVDQWSLDGEARHFMTDNFSIQGNLGFATADGSGSSLDSTSYGIGAEWQMDGAPLSIYGGWQSVDFDGGGDISSFGVGARWNWGGGTLIERNRSGASLGRPQGFLERFYGGFTPH